MIGLFHWLFTRASPAGRGGPAGVRYGGRVSMNEKELVMEGFGRISWWLNLSRKEIFGFRRHGQCNFSGWSWRGTLTGYFFYFTSQEMIYVVWSPNSISECTNLPYASKQPRKSSRRRRIYIYIFFVDTSREYHRLSAALNRNAPAGRLCNQ